jgi:hypothetical protein
VHLSIMVGLVCSFPYVSLLKRSHGAHGKQTPYMQYLSCSKITLMVIVSA